MILQLPMAVYQLRLRIHTHKRNVCFMHLGTIPILYQLYMYDMQYIIGTHCCVSVRTYIMSCMCAVIIYIHICACRIDQPRLLDSIATTTRWYTHTIANLPTAYFFVPYVPD